MHKRTVAVTLKLSPEEVELYHQAGEALYGKGHPVLRSTLIRELASRGARQILKAKKKRRF